MDSKSHFNMKIGISISLILLGVGLQGSYVIIKPEGKIFEGDNCASGYKNAISRIDREESVNIAWSRTEDLIETYGDNTPSNKPHQVTLVIGGSSRKAHDILASQAILLDASKKILDNCMNVGAVSLAVDGSSTHVLMGVFPDARIEPFRCISELTERPGDLRFTPKKPWPWGYSWC